MPQNESEDMCAFYQNFKNPFEYRLRLLSQVQGMDFIWTVIKIFFLIKQILDDIKCNDILRPH